MWRSVMVVAWIAGCGGGDGAGSSTEIGPAGGTVATDSLTLEIPAGALASTESITVTVTIAFTGESTGAMLVWSQAQGDGFDAIGGTVAGGELTGAITHFSGGFVG